MASHLFRKESEISDEKVLRKYKEHCCAQIGPVCPDFGLQRIFYKGKYKLLSNPLTSGKKSEKKTNGQIFRKRVIWKKILTYFLLTAGNQTPFFV